MAVHKEKESEQKIPKNCFISIWHRNRRPFIFPNRTYNNQFLRQFIPKYGNIALNNIAFRALVRISNSIKHVYLYLVGCTIRFPQTWAVREEGASLKASPGRRGGGERSRVSGKRSGKFNLAGMAEYVVVPYYHSSIVGGEGSPFPATYARPFLLTPTST